MQRSYTIDVAEDASALIVIEPFSFSSAEFLETTDFEGDTPEAWLEEHSMDIRDDEETWLEEHSMDIRDDEETWLEEQYMDISDDGEAWLEEQYMDITDDEADTHIPEDWLEENFTATMDDGENSEAKVIEHLRYGAANRDIDPLLDASFHNQVSTQQTFEDSSTRKVSIPEWIFLIINIVIELLSAAFDQLSSVNKPRYALIAMLMSFVAAITCIIELAYKAGKERVIWRWESKLPWFYYSSSSRRRFGTFPEMIGLVCAMLQTILSAVAYTFYLQHANYPFNVSFWPLIFAVGLLCSKFM